MKLKSLGYASRNGVLAVMLFVLAGCALTAPRPASVENAPEEQKSAVPPSEAFNLADPAAGLAEQKGYMSWLQQDVTGEIDGMPFERHTRLELARDGAQVDFLQEIGSGDGLDASTRLMQLGDALYRWQSKDDVCQGTVGKPEPGEIIEPARYLLPVRGAALVGNETVNGIPAAHYHFDQAALAPDKAVSSAAGEIWLAEPGGFVVKYTLAVTGQGLTQNWTYELRPLGAGEMIILPPACIEVPSDLPVLSDAQALARYSGWVNYTTVSTALDAANFYLQKLPEQGWTSMQKTLPAEPRLPFAATFTRENRHLSLTIEPSESSGLEITLFLTDSQSQPAVLTEAETIPSLPEPTIDPASTGLPADIPVYPGATSLIKMEGTVMFNVVDTPSTVAKFYRDQMASNGWSLKTEISSDDNIVQMWDKSGLSVTITLGTNDGESFVVVIFQ